MKKFSVLVFIFVIKFVFSDTFIASAKDFKVGDFVLLGKGYPAGEIILLLDDKRAAVKTSDKMGNTIFKEVDLSERSKAFYPHSDCFEGFCLNQEVFVSSSYGQVAAPGRVTHFYQAYNPYNSIDRNVVGVTISSDTDNFTPYEITVQASDVYPILGLTCAANFCIGDKYRLHLGDKAKVFVVKKIIGAGILYGQLVNATDSSFILSYAKKVYPVD